MPGKMARQTLERHAEACYAGSRPYLGSGLLDSPEKRYNLPHFRVHPGNPASRLDPCASKPGPDNASVSLKAFDDQVATGGARRCGSNGGKERRARRELEPLFGTAGPPPGRKNVGPPFAPQRREVGTLSAAPGPQC